MSGCRRHPGDPQVYDACCGGCVNDGELFLEAFGRLRFSGQVDMSEHHENTGRAAVKLLRANRYWGSADLLEAAIEAWNKLPRNQPRGGSHGAA